jgi:hypothetical protein
MPVTVVLAIGFDPWLFESQRTLWRSSGHFVTPATSISEGINHFRDGDFDAVLLGGMLSEESRERIISLIRSSGSTIPILCVLEPSGKCKACEFAATASEPAAVMQQIAKLLANPPKRNVADTVRGVGRFPASGRSRGMEVGRSGVKLCSQRAGLPKLNVAPFPLLELTDSSCFTICFDAAREASTKRGVRQPNPNSSGRSAS